jgi:hypothetical protein
MISVAPTYPRLEVPEGWTRETRGPRQWLVPPSEGGRVVVAPLQARTKHLSPHRFLEMVLLQERHSFPGLKQTKLMPFTSAQDLPGLIVDVAGVDEEEQPIEWRCYALITTPKLLALLFAQITPARHDELRRAFLDIVETVELPAHEVEAAPPSFEPWDEL